MDRYTRRQYFESLCRMRDAHDALGPDDTTTCLSIEDAIGYATDLLEAPATSTIDADQAHTEAI